MRRFTSVLILAMVVFLAACSKNESKPQTKPQSSEAATGDVTITLTTEPDPPKGGSDNKLRVSVLDNSGKPIPGAEVKVAVVMPAMPSMNMPEMREMATLQQSGSEYTGTVNIPMEGNWNITVEVNREGKQLGKLEKKIAAK